MERLEKNFKQQELNRGKVIKSNEEMINEMLYSSNKNHDDNEEADTLRRYRRMINGDYDEYDNEYNKKYKYRTRNKSYFGFIFYIFI